MRAPVRMVLTMAFMASAAAMLRAADEPLVVTIIDGYPASVGSSAGVFSDGLGDYRDWTLDPPGIYTNWCVAAAPFSPGNLFLQFNRKLDGLSGTMRCTENERPDGQLGRARQYVLRIANDTACEILRTANAGLQLWATGGVPWVSGAGPCTIAESNSPRVRLGTLYKPNARSTNIDFLTYVDGAPTSFEIRSDANASIQSMPGTKVVTYTGTFRLVRFDPGAKAKAVGPSFPMPVQMTFTMP